MKYVIKTLYFGSLVMKRKTLVVVGILTVMTQSAFAAGSEEALTALLDVLRKDGTLTEAKYTAIMHLVKSDQKPDVEQVSPAPPIKITTKGKLEMASPNEEFSMRIGGRIMAQGAVYNEDKSELGDGAEMRRARLFVSGKLWKVWNYKLQYDFTGSGKAGINDAYIQYTGLPAGKITLGHFKEPFSLQNITSSKYITFIERSQSHVLTPGRSLGISYGASGDNWTANIGLFGDGIDTPGGEVDQSHGLSGRATYAPYFTKEVHGLHLGVNYAYRNLDDNNTFRVRERPESHVTDRRLIDTGNFDAESLDRYAFEAMWFAGPFAVQGEYSRMSVDRVNAGNSDVNFDGYYVEGSWFITGESVNYDPAKGALSKITPKGIVGKGGIGAWQIAARFSSLDLNDEDINGGDEQNMTLGLNWYPNPNMRFMANYINVLDVDGGANDGDEPSAFVVQAQVEF